MAERKTGANWERIEREYLAGEDSIREIADRNEISESAIRKRAKREEWVRKVRTGPDLRTPAHLELERAAPAPSNPAEPKEAAEVAERGLDLIDRLLGELDAVTTHRGELEDLIFQATQDDAEPTRRNTMLKALSLGSRAGTAKTLASALKTLVEASAPGAAGGVGKKQEAQDKANALANVSRFAPMGPPTLKSVK